MSALRGHLEWIRTGKRPNGTAVNLPPEARRAVLRHFGAKPVEPEKPPAAPSPASPQYLELPCIHRGSVVREQVCKACGLKGTVAPIHACAIHGECTARQFKIPKMKACTTCPDRRENGSDTIEWKTDHVVPIRGEEKPFEGTAAVKPWEYRVQVVIPHLDTPDILELGIQLWRLQTVRPFICVVDTGSNAENVRRLLALESDDVEVHFVRSRGQRHLSSLVSVALDVAAANNLQEFQFQTHTDVFPMRRDILSDLISRCGPATPVVGYEISPRNHVVGAISWLWRGMVGHTCTMLHAPTIRQHGIAWHLERGHEDLGLARLPPQNTDTEVPFNLLLRKAGITPVLIGHDENHKRHTTADFDHFRSYGSSMLYSPGYFSRCSEWAQAAIVDARKRLAIWTEESNAQPQ